MIRRNKKTKWEPQIGGLASYLSRAGHLAGGGTNVRVAPATCARPRRAEANGRSGAPIRFTVKRENLAPMQPGLFD